MLARRTFRILMGTAVVSSASLGAVALDVACSGSSSSNAPAGLAQLEQDTGVSWAAVPDPRFGNTYYLFPNSPPPPVLTSGTKAADAAATFLDTYGGVFGIVDPKGELLTEDSGDTSSPAFASFTQTEGPAAVYGTRLSVVFDANGSIAYVVGTFVPGLHAFATKAALSASEAATKAETDMRKLIPASHATLEDNPAPQLTIYALDGNPTLAYSALVSYALDDATDTTARQRAVMQYLVDASSGAILQAVSGLIPQHQGTDVVAITGTGQGELVATPTRSFDVLATRGDGGVAKAPYYMQVGGEGPSTLPEMFVRIPAQETPAFVSPNKDTWDTAAVLDAMVPVSTIVRDDPGSAVDSFFYLGEVNAWWQSHHRDGWDNKGSALGIVVHDPTPVDPGTSLACTNNAYWDTKGSIHVCPHPPGALVFGGPQVTGALSVDLAGLAHEFQHAVTQAAFGSPYFGSAGEAAAIDESLSDISAEIVLHGTSPAAANCLFANTWVPLTGLRNMVDPHQTRYPGAQPDFYKGKDYVNGDADRHQNAGVSSKAWSLMTFGGADITQPTRRVDPSLALGWDDSEKLFLEMVASRGLAPAPTFFDLAWSLDGAAIRAFGGTTNKQRTANACAWYAVGVLSESDLKSWVGIEPCACSNPDAGTCDAGKDAAADGGAAKPRTVTCLSTVDGGTPVVCFTLSDAPTASAQTACSEVPQFSTYVVPYCPADEMIVGCCTVRTGTEVNQECFYPPATGPQRGAIVKDLCDLAKGVLSSYVAPPAANPKDAGAHDARVDSGDAGKDASVPPHC